MTTRIVTDSNGRKHITNEPILHTPQRQWVGLKPSEYAAFYNQFAKFQEKNPDISGWWAFADAIEAKLKEKNT